MRGARFNHYFLFSENEHSSF